MAISDNLFVIDQLTDKKVGLTTVNQRLTNQVSIASTYPDAFQAPASEIDDEVLRRIGTINALKQEIINLSQTAFTSVDGFGVPTCGVSSINADLEANNFVRSGSASTAIVVRGTGAGATTYVVSSAPVFPDLLRAWRFPDLENKTAVNDNPRDNAGYETMTIGSNTGIGQTSVVFQNGNYQGQTSGLSLGTYYEIFSGAALCNTTVAGIGTRATEIGNIRAGLSTLTNGVDILKEERTRNQLALWGYNYSIEQNTNTISDINDALNIMDDLPSFIGG